MSEPRGPRGNTGMILHRELTGQILDAATKVHTALGPGLLESAYEECLCHELRKQRIPFERQPDMPVIYDGVRIKCGFRPDVIVRQLVIVELKSVSAITPIHEAKLFTYLRLCRIRIGLLINFNVTLLKQGILRRIV